MNYLDFIPIEILYQIFVYIEVESIHERLFNDKLFFILKLKYEGVPDYTKYLGFTNSFINDYNLIHGTNDSIIKFMKDKGYIDLMNKNIINVLNQFVSIDNPESLKVIFLTFDKENNKYIIGYWYNVGQIIPHSLIILKNIFMELIMKLLSININLEEITNYVPDLVNNQIVQK